MKVAAVRAIRGSFGAVVAATYLAGCASGPDYVKPDIVVPTAFHHTASSAAPISLDEWWRHFNDPELTRLVELALAQNLDLQAAGERVVQARARAGVAQASLLPRVDAQASISAERQSLESPLGRIASRFPGYDRTPVLRDESLAASWESDLFGGLHRSVELRNAEVEVAQAERMGVKVSLVAEVADSYLRIRGARLRIAITEEELAADRGLLKLVIARRQDGMATEGEQAQAEARVAQLRSTLPPLHTELESQSNRLDRLLGAYPGTYSRHLKATPSPLSLPTIGSDLLPADMLRRRPDVVAAERRLAASSAAIGVATAEYYPKISLSGLLGMQSLQTGIPNGDNFQPQLVLGLRWRLFDFGAIDAEVEGAKAANRGALLAYRDAMLRATNDVEDALLTSAYLSEEHTALQQEVDAAGRARSQAHEAYIGGVESLTNELEFEREYSASRDRLSAAETNVARSLVATFRALGGGW